MKKAATASMILAIFILFSFCCCVFIILYLSDLSRVIFNYFRYFFSSCLCSISSLIHSSSSAISVTNLIYLSFLVMSLLYSIGKTCQQSLAKNVFFFLNKIAGSFLFIFSLFAIDKNAGVVWTKLTKNICKCLTQTSPTSP